MQWANHAKMAAPWHLELPRLRVKEACSHAARCGNREVLQWLHNTGCPWDATTCAVAAGRGHLEVVKWLHSHGCPCDWRVCAFAAEFGHLLVMLWARAHHCPWDSGICSGAAMRGHMEVLQWIRENDENGEVWDEHRVHRFNGGPKKQEILTWLDGLSGP